MASAPVQSTSIQDTLALAESLAANLSGCWSGAKIPSAEDIAMAMPDGLSLDEMPNPMAGQAGNGGIITPGAPEWFSSYNVDIAGEGERIASLWFARLLADNLNPPV